LMNRNWLKLQGANGFLLKLFIMTVIQSVAIIMAAKWLSGVISSLFAGEPPVEQAGAMGLFLLFFLLRHGMQFLMDQAASRFAERTGAGVRKQLLKKLVQNGPRFAKREGTGNLVTLVLEGVTQFRTYLELFFPRMIFVAVTPALLLVYVYTLDVTSGLILTVTLPVLIVFLILVGLAAQKHTEKQLASFRVLSNHFVDSLRGLETLKFLGRSRAHGHTMERVSNRYREATMRTLRVAFLSSFALEFFTMLSVASVAVHLGLQLIKGHMPLATALAILILAPEYFLPVRMVGADYHATLDGKEAGEAIFRIIGQKEEPVTAKLPASFAWDGESTLSLTSLVVRHEEKGSASLDKVSFAIQGLQKVGIVGESGAGKSTLIDVLAGFKRPEAGSVCINGIKLSSLMEERWRGQTTYIPQHPYLFSASLEDNIRFYKPDATREEVEKAAASAGLTKLIQTLPGGLEQIVGNGGRSLSGGQEQRVALARAFLSDRPVVLLDEPTAHLDVETEYELKETMLRLFENKLVFLATHRLHWMPHMDVVLVLDKGKVVETGTHEELLAQKGLYYQLFQAQREGLA
jgi:ATP-binding cassette, subfamily C, bacterial CydD